MQVNNSLTVDSIHINGTSSTATIISSANFLSIYANTVIIDRGTLKSERVTIRSPSITVDKNGVINGERVIMGTSESPSESIIILGTVSTTSLLPGEGAGISFSSYYGGGGIKVQ